MTRLPLVLLLPLQLCLLPTPAQAEELSCKYYSVRVPAGWYAVTPPTENQGMYNAVFVKGSGYPSVSLLAGETGGADLKTIADIFAEQYKATKPPTLKNGRYFFNFTREDKPCQAWITVQGQSFMVATLIGSPREGLRFVRNNVRSADYPDLLP